jgi:hypothetical protein
VLYYGTTVSVLYSPPDVSNITPPPTDEVYAQGFIDGNVDSYTDGFNDGLPVNYRRLY